MPSESKQPQAGSSPPSDELRNDQGAGSIKNDPAGSHDLKAKVSDDLEAARKAVTDTASTAVENIENTVAQQTNFAAQQVGGIAIALRKVATELENGDQAQVARYAKQIGESAEVIANNLKGRDLGEIAGMAEDYGRRQPLAFLGFAALAGLAASRFLTASATRNSSSSAASGDVQGAREFQPSSATDVSRQPGGGRADDQIER
jgi:hypothetical protein